MKIEEKRLTISMKDKGTGFPHTSRIMYWYGCSF